MEDLMKENLSWNFKAVNSILFNVWAPKVDNEELQKEFFDKILKARDLEAEREAKKAAEEEGEGG